MRLHPTMTRKYTRTFREAGEPSNVVSDPKLLASPEDESSARSEERLKLKQPSQTSRSGRSGIFGVMFENPMRCLASCTSGEPATESERDRAKMPPKRTKWWQVTLYIINDVVGASLLLYSSLILGMYG